MPELGPRYEHKEIEEDIYRKWEESGYFNPDKLPRSKAKAKPFSIVMPPPNANGSLHMGHAVFATLQDIMTRYWRMKGKQALWLPGADHAGFETQTVFDKKLDKEGRNRFAMEREALWQEIWDFTQTNKKVMEGQLRKLGASCDWSREIFTLDPRIIEGVYSTFEKMYKDGLVYRDYRVVNWCPKHRTALSDLEVKYIERVDPLYYIKYGPLTLATVRPETKFGDTALAVNPKDKRYKKYIGQEIEAEGILGKLKFRVVGDAAIDPKFGTGVVKVTPAHDTTDFEIWKRHEKEIPGPKIIIDESGRLTGEVGEFKGLKVAEARIKVAEKMQEIGILEKVDAEYKHQVATCYRCNSTLEPMPKPQWFVKMEPLAKEAIKAVEAKKIKFYPDNSKKVCLHWLRNIHDWNISRQIIWGIRIPAWFCNPKNEVKRMGFYYKIVPQVLKGKARTYRLNDHHLKVGDVIACEDSQAKTFFGHAKITAVAKKKIKDIVLPDPIHGGGYKTLDELLTAFRRHYPPDRVITGDTETLIYDFQFIPFSKENPSGGCNYIYVGNKAVAKCPNCNGNNLVQDPDVFDTWFSSGQWPYLTLLAQGKNIKHGTRNNKQELGTSKDFENFYPTDVMETGYDILFFWVTRMIMLGLYRTGKVPFKNVYLHGMVRDKDRQKMSKSKGNVVDPLGVAEEYGTDAVRMAITVGNTAGNDIVISEDKIRGYRNFATKLWNIARFVMMQKEKIEGAGVTAPKMNAHDKKAVEQAHKVRLSIGKKIDNFQFHLGAEEAYHYIWHTFADKIIESAKPKLMSEKRTEQESAYLMLLGILEESLMMLHPFMPFVTEHIYQQLPGSAKYSEMLMIKKW